MSNLLDNAIKFTSARCRGVPADQGHGVVAIELLHDDAAQHMRLLVSDNGLGIEPEHLPHVFDRFYRADKARVRDAAAGGTGLGLSICKAIVEAHGGQIAVQSRVGHGATLTVALPVVTAPADAPLIETLGAVDPLNLP